MEKSGVLAIGSPGKAFFFTTMAFQELLQDALPRFVSGVKPPYQDSYVMRGIVFPNGMLSSPASQGNSNALLQFAAEQVREFHPSLRRIVDAAQPEDTLLVPLRASPRVKEWVLLHLP
jgi:hypothetical protein